MQEGFPCGEAERLLTHPLIERTLDTLEGDAVEAIIHTDDADRRALRVFEVRAIRSLREKLKTLAEGKALTRKPGDVA
ncbi:MAG: hypothetical protein V6Z86_10005 [Hyphomicrobiales bacterium]